MREVVDDRNESVRSNDNYVRSSPNASPMLRQRSPSRDILVSNSHFTMLR